MNSRLSGEEIKELIEDYLKNSNIVEAISNKSSIRYFSEDFLKGIEKLDTNYVFEMAKELNKKSQRKRIILNMVTRLNIF